MNKQLFRISGCAFLAVAFVMILATPATAGGSTCPAPKDNQVVVYSGTNFSGACRVLDLGNYPNRSHFAPASQGSVSSLVTGSRVRVALFEKAGYAGVKTYYEGGLRYRDLGKFAGKAGSVAVIHGKGGPLASTYLGTYPLDAENFWSNDSQGLANDGDNWFVIKGSTADNARIFKIPLSYDLGSETAGRNPSAGIPPDLKRRGYHHLGDPDRWGEFLLVPVQGDGVPPRIAVFDTRDLRYITSAVIPSAPDSAGGWLAVRGSDGTVWMSAGWFKYLMHYAVDWAHLAKNGELVLSRRADIPVYLWDEALVMTLSAAQGGVFNPEGTILYFASGACAGLGYIYAFAIVDGKAILQARSANGYGPFNYEMRPKSSLCLFGECVCRGDETEGLDWLDVSGRGVPGVPEGKLHLVVVNNKVLTRDGVHIKHYGTVR
jgi:hypothetical protein